MYEGRKEGVEGCEEMGEKGRGGGIRAVSVSTGIGSMAMKRQKQMRWVGGRCRGDVGGVAAWRERDRAHQKKLRQKSGGSQTRNDWISSLL